jgi:hypothetical protein
MSLKIAGNVRALGVEAWLFAKRVLSEVPKGFGHAKRAHVARNGAGKGEGISGNGVQVGEVFIYGL